MKIIFLDVDGVLNYWGFKELTPNKFLGISDDLVEKLKRIIEKTDAKIVLTSTWKDGISDDMKAIDDDGQYLLDKLWKSGISIYSKTVDFHYDRGRGISNWLSNHTDVEKYVVLDDICFKDFEEYGVINNVVITNEIYGITDDNVEQSVNILTEE